MEHEVAHVPLAAADLLESLPVPCGLLDHRGRLLAVNEAWIEAAVPGGLIGPGDKRGAPYLEGLETGRGFAYESGRDLAAAIRSVLEGDAPRTTVLYEVGDAQWEATVTKADGSGCDAVVIHVDRSAEAAAASWRQAYEEAATELESEKAWRRARNVSLRAAVQTAQAPVTPIRAHLFRLLRQDHGPLTPEQRDTLAAIERGVDAWWQAQAALEFDDDGTARPLEEVVHEIVHTCREEALTAGVDLQADIGPVATPCQQALRHAILLAVSHAVRASPSGGKVHVALAATPMGARIDILDDDPAGREALRWPGLRFAAAAAQAQGGRLDAEVPPDRTGLHVRIEVPLLAHAEPEATGMAVQ